MLTEKLYEIRQGGLPLGVVSCNQQWDRPFFFEDLEPDEYKRDFTDSKTLAGLLVSLTRAYRDIKIEKYQRQLEKVEIYA